ncbi:hypothetical protein ABNM01_19395 [Pseudomonas syringae]
MSNGMMVWGADGALQLDETSFTIRVVLSTLVTFSGTTKTSQDFAVPGVGPGTRAARTLATPLRVTARNTVAVA